MAIYSKLHPNIRIADLSGISNRIVEFLEGQNLTPYAEYREILPNLQTLTEALTVAMARNTIKSALAELDAVRDTALRSLNHILKGYASLTVTSVSEPAQRLLHTFSKYGLAIVDYRYDAQSGEMQSLLQDLATPQAVADITALAHVAHTVNELSSAQHRFETTKIAHDRAMENYKANTRSASTIKPQLIDVINNQLINYHIAMVQFKDASFKHIADTVNNWITDANRNRQNTQQEPEAHKKFD